MSSWTAADQAELDCLLHELTRCYFDHRERCRHCLACRDRLPGSLPCPHLRTAIAVVLDWREARALLSRAEQLRIDQAILIHRNVAA